MISVAEIKTFLIAMSPLLELRGSIPLAITVYGMPAWTAYVVSVIGNMVPVVFILWLLGWASGFLSRRSGFFNLFFAALFKRTRASHQEKFQKWESFALMILVAIPLPFTGAWTGSLAAFVFGIPFKKAFPMILLGVMIAGVIVTLSTLGIVKLI